MLSSPGAGHAFYVSPFRSLDVNILITKGYDFPGLTPIFSMAFRNGCGSVLVLVANGHGYNDRTSTLME